MWVYIPSIRPNWGGNIDYMEYNIDYVNKVSLSLKYMEERDEWVKLEKTFTTKPGQTKLSMNFNAGETPKEMWLDDFRITEIDSGSTVDTVLSYCEYQYNLFKSSKDYNDILSGKSGVYEIKTSPSSQYTFGVTTIGGNSNSKVYLSFDGEALMPQSEENAPLAIAKMNTTRLGTELVSPQNGIMYLVIENPDNAMQIQNIQLFKTKSLSTSRDMGYENNPNLPEHKLNVETLKLIGEGGEGNSPATGDYKTLLPALFIVIISLAALCFIGFRKKEEL